MPQYEKIHKYEVAPNSQGQGVTLIKDGVECFCHMLMPFVIPGAIAGTSTLSRMNCNTQCPHANLYQRTKHPQGGDSSMEEGMVYSVTCNGAAIEFVVTELEKTPSGKQDSKIIQLGGK